MKSKRCDVHEEVKSKRCDVNEEVKSKRCVVDEIAKGKNVMAIGWCEWGGLPLAARQHVCQPESASTALSAFERTARVSFILSKSPISQYLKSRNYFSHTSAAAASC